MNLIHRLSDRIRQRSIRYKMLFGFLVMVIGMAAINLTTVFSTQSFLREYHVIASRIATANSLVPIARELIGTEAYYVVAGRETLQTTMLFDYVTEVSDSLSQLEQGSTIEKNRKQLRIAARTLGTLEKYCSQLRRQSMMGVSLVEQNATLEQIRDVSSLIGEQMNEYIYLELTYMDELDQQIQQRARQILIGDAGTAVLILMTMALIQIMIDQSISGPIEQLVENTKRLSEGDFGVRVESADKNEITVLNESFNRMVEKLQRLMTKLQEDTRTREQLELRLMQEQINPHFLYNTLEIIVWLVESSDKEKVVGVVQSLSRFYRVALSQGRAVVTIREELDCIQSYLYIQQVRYMDIMTYRVCVDEAVLDNEIQKLTLQPLVENALYHGIERQRGGGTIWVEIRRNGETIEVVVSDDGCGMDETALLRLRRAIADKNPIGGGFGLSNVQKRVQLAYGPEYGIEIESAQGRGTRVILRIPAKPEENRVLP